jgi:hypothetical protein
MWSILGLFSAEKAEGDEKLLFEAFKARLLLFVAEVFKVGFKKVLMEDRRHGKQYTLYRL